MTSDAEVVLMRLAARQHNAFTRRQALAVGVHPSMIRRRVRSGLWVDVYRGVFASASAHIDWRLRVMGAALAGGPKAFASHRSAGAVWGLLEDRATPPEITIPHGTRRTDRRLVVHRSHRLECTTRDGFCVSTPMRTLLDLATVLSTETLERAVDDAHRRGLIRMRRLAGYLAEPANAALPGSGELRRIVEHRDPDRPIASELESGFFAGLRRVGLPTPTPQHRVVVASGRERFIDFAYPNQKVAIELDGYRDHATPAAFVSDRVRQNEIQALGWRFFRFTWDQVMSGTIAYLIPLADGLGLEPSRWRPKARRQRFNASRPRAAQPVR